MYWEEKIKRRNKFEEDAKKLEKWDEGVRNLYIPIIHAHFV